jgi:hypothetical protein
MTPTIVIRQLKKGKRIPQLHLFFALLHIGECIKNSQSSGIWIESKQQLKQQSPPSLVPCQRYPNTKQVCASQFQTFFFCAVAVLAPLVLPEPLGPSTMDEVVSCASRASTASFATSWDVPPLLLLLLRQNIIWWMAGTDKWLSRLQKNGMWVRRVGALSDKPCGILEILTN